MTSLNGKTAIVTGGAKGIGRMLSLALIRAGANVVASGRDEAALRRLTSELDGEQKPRCVTLRTDVTRESECRQLLDTSISSFGRIDILVNNAGRGMREINEDFFLKPQPFWKADTDVWRAIIDTNVNGPFLMAKAVAPHMAENGWGWIINISTNYETMQRPSFSPYGPSKAGLEALTAVFATDLEGTGVTVNSLLPGERPDRK